MAKKKEPENNLELAKNEKENEKVEEKKSTTTKKNTKKENTKKETSKGANVKKVAEKKVEKVAENEEDTKKQINKTEKRIEDKVSDNKENKAKKITTEGKKVSPKKENKEEVEKKEVEETENMEETSIIPKEETIQIEEIKETIKQKKVVPKEQVEKINKLLFRNIVIAVCVIIYFTFLNLGHMNIKGDIYVTDLKVFSMCTLLIAIALIENAYKKDSGEIALYGVEMIVLSLLTVSLIYVNLMLSTRYTYIVSAISYIFGIYYLVKSIIIYIRKRKQYFVEDMKEMINKDE